MTFAVRPAEPSDAQGLKDLGDEVAAEPEGWLATTDGWRTAADERRYLRAIRRYPHAAVFVAEAEDGAVVGRLSAARDQHPASRHVADVGLMVAQSHRRRGVGRALLGAAVEWALGEWEADSGEIGRLSHRVRPAAKRYWSVFAARERFDVDGRANK